MLRILASRAAVQAARFPGAQQQHLRFLAKYKGGGGGGKGGGGGGGGGRGGGGGGGMSKGGGGGGGGGGGAGFSLRMVYSKYDLEDDDQDPEVADEDNIKFRGNATMRDVQKSLEENYGMEGDEVKDLEYYMNGEWKPFKDPAALKGKQSVPIRNPDSYDDSSYDEPGGDGDDEEYDPSRYDDDAMDDDDLSGSPLAMQIREIIADLHKKEYIHNAATLQLKSKSGEVMSTKDYILKQSLTDVNLQEALVSKIGCLDHIVQCIHFQFLWTEADNKSKKGSDKDTDSD